MSETHLTLQHSKLRTCTWPVTLHQLRGISLPGVVAFLALFYKSGHVLIGLSLPYLVGSGPFRPETSNVTFQVLLQSESQVMLAAEVTNIVQTHMGIGTDSALCKNDFARHFS